ncbi:Hypothetical protein NocV09_05000120 [Nannochloropsis oceanica]
MTGNNAVHATFQVYSKVHSDVTPYLSVASDHVKADTAGGDHAVWTVEHLPKDHVALKAHNGHYLSINSHGQIHMSKDRSHEAHFIFIKEDLDHPGCVAIKEPVHNTFLTFDAHGHLIAKKGLSELDDPAKLPFFKMEEKKTAHKEQHHGHHHH